MLLPPAAGYVDGGGSLVIGVVAGVACAIAIELKWKTRCGLRIDDRYRPGSGRL